MGVDADENTCGEANAKATKLRKDRDYLRNMLDGAPEGARAALEANIEAISRQLDAVLMERGQSLPPTQQIRNAANRHERMQNEERAAMEKVRKQEAVLEKAQMELQALQQKAAKATAAVAEAKAKLDALYCPEAQLQAQRLGPVHEEPVVRQQDLRDAVALVQNTMGQIIEQFAQNSEYDPARRNINEFPAFMQQFGVQIMHATQAQLEERLVYRQARPPPEAAPTQMDQDDNVATQMADGSEL